MSPKAGRKRKSTRRTEAKDNRPARSGAASDANAKALSSGDAAPTSMDARGIAFTRAAAALVGLLIFWAFEVPADSIGVYQGQALPQNLFWFVACLLVCIAVALRGSRRIAAWTTAGLIAAFLLLWLTTQQAGAISNPRQLWMGNWQVISLLGGFFCVRYLAVGNQTRAALIGVCLAGCVASSLYGLYQVTVDFPAARARYLENPDAEIAKIPNLVAPEGSPQRMRFENRLLNSREPLAKYALANSLAVVLTAGLVIVIGMLTQIRPSKFAANYREWVVLICVALMLFACWILTRSRAAIVGAGVGVVLATGLAFLRGRSVGLSRKSLVAVTLALSAAFALIGIWFWQNDELVITEAQKSLGFRLQYWSATTEMIQDHPLLGVGLGNFQAYYPLYKSPLASEEIADPHNWLFDVGATLGIPMLLLCCLALAGLARQALRVDSSGLPDSELADEDQQIALAVLRGALVGGSLCGLLLVLLTGASLVSMIACWLPAAAGLLVVRKRLERLASEGRWWICAAWIAMLVTLLASGSWQASGLAVPILVLVATSQPSLVRASPSRWPLLIAVLGTCAFVFQAWMPVTRAWAIVQNAQLATGSTERTELFRQALEVDSLDTNTQSWVAHALTEQAITASAMSFGKASQNALDAWDRWLARDGLSFSHWRQAAGAGFQLSHRARQLGLDDASQAGRTAQYCQEAALRYPTSVELQMYLAVAFWLQGDQSRMSDALTAAEDLSSQSPHLDKQLSSQMISFPFEERLEIPTDAPPGMVEGEPLLKWLRSKLE